MLNSNTLSWQQVKPDFSSSNRTMGLAIGGLSRAGDIFSKMRDRLAAEEQQELENEQWQKDYNEKVRQFGLTHQLNVDELNENIRSHKAGEKETSRHNKANEGIDRFRAQIDAENILHDNRLADAAEARAQFLFDQTENNKRIENDVFQEFQNSKDAASIELQSSKDTFDTTRQALIDFNRSIKPDIPMTKEQQQQYEQLYSAFKTAKASYGAATKKFAEKYSATGLIQHMERGVRSKGYLGIWTPEQHLSDQSNAEIKSTQNREKEQNDWKKRQGDLLAQSPKWFADVLGEDHDSNAVSGLVSSLGRLYNEVGDKVDVETLRALVLGASSKNTVIWDWLGGDTHSIDTDYINGLIPSLKFMTKTEIDAALKDLRDNMEMAERNRILAEEAEKLRRQTFNIPPAEYGPWF